MSQPHYFTVSGDPRQGFEVAKAVLQQAGFTLSPEAQPFVVEAERGSKGMTVALGAFAGKKNQHLRAQLRGIQQDGANVIQLVPDTTGMAGGAIGMSRANTAYDELARAVAERLYSAGILVATSVPSA